MTAKIRTIGPYAGIAVDPTVDTDKVCSDAAEAGYTSISVFLSTIFFGKIQPIDKHGIVPEWRAHWRRLLTSAAKAGISIHGCAVDQFHGPNEAGPNDHQNDIFQDVDEEVLYSSYADGVKHWLWWSDTEDPKFRATPEDTLKQFKPIGAFGKFMWSMVAMQVRVAAQVRDKFPDTPEPTRKWGNETLAQKIGEKPNGEPDVKPLRHDRNETDIWFSAMWEAEGFKRSNQYSDYVCLDHTKPGNSPAYDVMRSVLEDNKKLGTKLEIHHVLSVEDAQAFRFAPKDLKLVKFSTDGDLHMVGDYPGLGHSALPDVDLKMDSRVVKDTCIMDFWNRLMPRYKKYVK